MSNIEEDVLDFLMVVYSRRTSEDIRKYLKDSAGLDIEGFRGNHAKRTLIKVSAITNPEWGFMRLRGDIHPSILKARNILTKYTLQDITDCIDELKS